VPHGELTAKKWLHSIEKQKKKKHLKQRDKHRQTDWQSQRQKINRRGDQQTHRRGWIYNLSHAML